MSINNSNRKAGPFSGNDAATVFPFTFKVFQPSDLLVVQADDVTFVETTLVEGIDYTATLNTNQNSSPGGSITLPIPLATGKTLIITSNIDAIQAVDLTNNGGFYPEVITDALDKLTILVQQTKEVLNRTVQTPITEVMDAATLIANINLLVSALPSLGIFAVKTSSSGSLVMPSGSTAQRDASPAIGYTRWNATLGCNETWSGTAWAQDFNTAGNQPPTPPNQPGRLIGIRVFNTPGTFTYTPTTGTLAVLVKAVGAGAGSSGYNIATGYAAIAQGQKGAYAEAYYTSGFAGVTITIGAGGAAGASTPTNGGAGGATSFGSLLVCPGGGASSSANVGASLPIMQSRYICGGIATGTGIIFKIDGDSQVYTTTILTSISPLCYLVNGQNATPLGLHGSGGQDMYANGSSSRAGYAGGDGMIIIYEYA